jgi:hypothetical protein
LRFVLHDRPQGADVPPGNRVVLDVERGEASYGKSRVEGHALVWELDPTEEAGALLAVDLDLDSDVAWLMRCDRVDFPPGGIAYRHVHPGPGIRYLLFGQLRIDGPDGFSQTFHAGEPWFEGADHPVVATASEASDTAFVRVLLLPRAWEGKRTIRYLDPADDEKPRLQRATVYLEEPIDL